MSNFTQTSKGPRLSHPHFLTLADFSKEELLAILYEAELIRSLSESRGENITLRVEGEAGSSVETTIPKDLYGKCLSEHAVSLLFLRPSTRTRAAAEMAVFKNGGHPLLFSEEASQLSRGESVEDTIKCLEQYSAAFIIRTPEHSLLTRAGAATDRPVINALSDEAHPIEALANLLTLNRYKGKPGKNPSGNLKEISFAALSELKGAYLGDGSNVATSLAWAAHKLGVHLTVASPEAYACPPEIKEQLSASETVEFIEDPIAAVREADAIFGDTFVSMGVEAEREKREEAFRAYQVNETLVRHAKPDYVYLHCLPAYRSQEVTSAIIDGDHSIVFDIAMSRLLIYRAVLKVMMRGFTIEPNALRNQGNRVIVES